MAAAFDMPFDLTTLICVLRNPATGQWLVKIISALSFKIVFVYFSVNQREAYEVYSETKRRYNIEQQRFDIGVCRHRLPNTTCHVAQGWTKVNIGTRWSLCTVWCE